MNGEVRQESTVEQGKPKNSERKCRSREDRSMRADESAAIRSTRGGVHVRVHEAAARGAETMMEPSQRARSGACCRLSVPCWTLCAVSAIATRLFLCRRRSLTRCAIG